MSVRLGTPEAFPVVVGIYVCRCGRTTEQHGFHAGEEPPGWIRVAEGDEAQDVCPDCVPFATAEARS